MGVSIGEELAIRAGLDPAWMAVLRVYLEVGALYPDPFQPRAPRPPTAPPSPDPPAGS
jgi:hypothetical protein